MISVKVCTLQQEISLVQQPVKIGTKRLSIMISTIKIQKIKKAIVRANTLISLIIFQHVIVQIKFFHNEVIINSIIKRSREEQFYPVPPGMLRT